MGYPVDTLNTKSLLHFNGYHNQLSVTDWSGKAWTVTGTAKLDAGHKKFGNASLYLDGSGYISTPDHVDWTLESGPWSIEAFFRGYTVGTQLYQWNTFCIASKYQDDSNYWLFYVTKYKDMADPRGWGAVGDFYWLTFVAVSNGTTVSYIRGLINNYYLADGWILNLWQQLLLPENLRSTDTWGGESYPAFSFNHVAVVDTGSELKLFFNGYQIFDYVTAYAYTGGNYTPVGGVSITPSVRGTIVDTTGSVCIGKGYATLYGGTSNAVGYIDEFRFVKGVDLFTSLYQSSGTVMPTKAYTKHGVDDEYTTMLIHFDAQYTDTATGNNYLAKSATAVLDDATYVWIKSMYIPTSTYITYLRQVPSLYNTLTGQAYRMHNLDFWYKVTSLPASGARLGLLLDQGATATDGSGSVTLDRWITISNVSGSYYYSLLSNSVYTTVLIPDGLVVDTWYHVGFSFDPANSVAHVGHNGKYIGSLSSAQYINASYPYRNIVFGYYAGAGTSFTEYIDEVRISMDCLRYTADYTVNTEEYGTTLSNRELNEAMMIGEEFETNFREVSDAMTISELFTGGYQYDVLLDEEASVAYTTNAAYAKQISVGASANFTLDSTILTTKRDFSFSVGEFIDSYKYYILSGAAETPAFIGTGQCGFAANFYLEIPAFTGSGFCGARADSNDSPAFTGDGQATSKIYIDCSMVVDSPVFKGTGSMLVGVLCEQDATMPSFEGNASMLRNITAIQATITPIFIGYGDAIVSETHTEEDITEFDNYILWHEHEGFVCYHRVKMPLPTGTGSAS